MFSRSRFLTFAISLTILTSCLGDGGSGGSSTTPDSGGRNNTVSVTETTPVTSDMEDPTTPSRKFRVAEGDTKTLTLSYTGGPATSCGIPEYEIIVPNSECTCDASNVCTIELLAAEGIIDEDGNGGDGFIKFFVTTASGVRSNVSYAPVTISAASEAPVGQGIPVESAATMEEGEAGVDIVLPWTDRNDLDYPTGCAVTLSGNPKLENATCNCTPQTTEGVCTATVSSIEDGYGADSFTYTVTTYNPDNQQADTSVAATVNVNISNTIDLPTITVPLAGEAITVQNAAGTALGTGGIVTHGIQDEDIFISFDYEDIDGRPGFSCRFDFGGDSLKVVKDCECTNTENPGDGNGTANQDIAIGTCSAVLRTIPGNYAQEFTAQDFEVLLVTKDEGATRADGSAVSSQVTAASVTSPQFDIDYNLQEDMVITMVIPTADFTEGDGSQREVILPLVGGETYNFDYSWECNPCGALQGATYRKTGTGDANSPTFTLDVHAPFGGGAPDVEATVTITIEADPNGDGTNAASVPRLDFSTSDEVSYVTSLQLGSVGLTSMSNMCNGCSALSSVTGGNTAAVTNMGGAFSGATALAGGTFDASTWRFDSVTTMANMFSGVTLDTEDYNNFLTRITDQVTREDDNTVTAQTDYEIGSTNIAGRSIKANVAIHGGNSRTDDSSGSDGTAAKAILSAAPFNWTFTDGD